jgi:Flp pilus assembly pilin Flp
VIEEEIEVRIFKDFFKDESGMETLEYAVIAGLIAAVAVLVYASGWGTTLSTRLTNATTTG